MVWDIAVAGTVTLDDVVTPEGSAVAQQGGSAVYFALAASRYARVHAVGTVGADGMESLHATLAGCDVSVEGVEPSPLPTMHWWARHDFERWVTADERTEQGAYDAWRPVLPRAAAAAPVLFAGSMGPDLQVEALHQSGARLIGSDSMTVYIGRRGDDVRAVAEASDVLFLNRSELSGLTGQDPDDWLESARALCGRGRLRAVVVKAGPVGAAVVTASSVIERAAHPVEKVVDPTGAGDSLAGGFLGACARAERDDDEFFGTALGEGLRCAADAIVAFGPAVLRRRASTAHLVPD
ncbi:MAG TPA: PfkB family carbohydrate kinase [Candidatus Angelobacter sp.]|nr:PfkB family carbohydrate kinase [Candidatus Angelobacter sp.]